MMQRYSSARVGGAVLAGMMVLFSGSTLAAWDGGEHECGGACLAHRLEAMRWFASADRERPGFDPLTGRDLLNYPPHPHVDYHHMRIDIDIPDMSVPRLDAVQTLTVSPVANALDSLSLNAALLEIERVMVDGREAEFEHDGSELRVRFDPPLMPGVKSEIVTSYRVNDPPYGLLWTLPGNAWPGRAGQIHTQGQPEDNRYWFPMHDFPNVRLSTELVVTVPAGYTVLSNGRLVSGPGERPQRGRDRHTFHWLQEKPHVTYLVSLVVGQFDVVDVARRGDKVPMPVYVPPGRAGDVERTYGNTSRMMDVFAKLVDEPYPWDQYAQAVVHNFAPGGMENTSATTMYDTAILTEQGHWDQGIEGLISHELAHQWFGDLITCNSWEHIWLNEGFATYFTNLWFEHKAGAGTQAGRDAYFDGVIGNFDRVIAADKADAPYQPAMASKVYDEPWDVFRRAANPYPKGASVLHMLRQRLGDEVFYRSLAVYTDQFSNTTPETNDLRKVMEEVSGESLEQFYRQWVFRPGVPALEVELSWDRSSSELVVDVEQVQNVDGYNPAFEFVLPVWVETATGGARGGRGERDGRMMHIEVSGREASGRFRLDSEPRMAAVDPEMTVLAKMRIRQPVSWWEAQLAEGPTLFAKVRAVRALASRDGELAAALLLATARGESHHPRLRSEAARALGRGGNARALLELAKERIDIADVRVAVVEALAEVAMREGVEQGARAAVIEQLAAAAGPGERSYRARAEALGALARAGAKEHLRLIIGAADSESQHDRVRQAALRALGELGEADGLATAIRYALPGTYNRTRPAAMEAVGKLSHHDKASSMRVLTMMLEDRERRAWEAAGNALVAIGDRSALAHLERLIEAKPDERDRARIREWMVQLSGEHAEEAEPEPEAPAAEEPSEVVDDAVPARTP